MIECYYKWCKHHSFNYKATEGPFCEHYKCIATSAEIEKFERLRKEELKKPISIK